MTTANCKILYEHFTSKGMIKNAEEMKERIMKREPDYFKVEEVEVVEEKKESKSKGKK